MEGIQPSSSDILVSPLRNYNFQTPLSFTGPSYEKRPAVTVGRSEQEFTRSYKNTWTLYGAKIKEKQGIPKKNQV